MAIGQTLREIGLVIGVELQAGPIRVLIGIEEYIDSVILIITVVLFSPEFSVPACSEGVLLSRATIRL